MLAAEETTIAIEQARATLRPTLRAAMRLERRYGFNDLFRLVNEVSIPTIIDLVHETAIDGSAELEQAIWNAPAQVVAALVEPLLSHVINMTGIDADELTKAVAEGAQPAGGTITFTEHLSHLFEIATGSIGWTPSVAWNASPAEIIAAQRGRMNLLKSIFGSDEQSGQGPSLEEKAKLALAGFNFQVVRA
jgi:hypothetical protein